MQYGYFDNDSREYVITRPDTPRPWSNYIGSAEFGGIVTNNAAGYTFYRSAAQGRLSRYKFNAVPADLNGRFVYLHDTDDGDFWSHSWMPVGKSLEHFKSECRHGTGYTTIQSVYRSIESEVSYFVPLGEHYETWKITVRNAGDTQRTLKVFPFVEPQCNWSAEDDMKNLQYNQYISVGNERNGIIEIGSNVNMPKDEANFVNKDQARHTFYGLAGAEATQFDCDLTRFLGSYGTYSNPQAVRHGACSGSQSSSDMPAAAFEISLKLAPGESKTFAIVFGVGEAADKGQAAVESMSTPEKIDTSLNAVKNYWHSRLNTLSAKTPDPAFDSMLNTWAPFNNLMTFYWSRAASLVYAGERDGLGFRDTLQDFVGSAALIPEETKERLELMLTGQFAHGGCKPIVQPFHHTPGQEAQPDHLRADDGMWFFNAIPTYVKETGDLSFYSKVLPYADKGDATVLQHMRRAIEFNLDHSGAHGLPCGLHADWNDCIRLGEQGETIFVAMQLRFALAEYIEITNKLHLTDEIKWAEAQLNTLDKNLEQHAWDGEWYLRAYREDGFKFGSKDSAEGKIFMNPQTWAVLSGATSEERARQVMDQMHQHLNTEYGIMLCTPPYVSTDPKVCLGRLFNPGTKENGGIFNHTQGWAVMAAAKLGMGNRAYTYLRNVMPSRYNDIADIRESEPYVVCQSTHSPDSPRYGAGRVSWLSGSAVWNYVAMSQSILGIYPEYDGLRIDPCIPAEWKSFEVNRVFRASRYTIQILNPYNVEKGVRSITVNGSPIHGNCIQVPPPNSDLEVCVTMG